MANKNTDFYDDDDDDFFISDGSNSDSIDFTDDDKQNDKTSDTKTKLKETPEEKEDREIAEDTIVRGYNRMRAILYSIAAVIFISLCTWLWLRYFSPYTTEATETGCIMELKCQGLLFKTYEGTMLSKKYISRPEDWFTYDFPFSIDDDSIAQQVMQLKGTGKLVTLHYEEYQGTVFWRGNSHRIIKSVEIVNEEKE